MIDMYERYGYYKDDIKSITLKGIEGLEKDPGNLKRASGKSSC